MVLQSARSLPSSVSLRLKPAVRLNPAGARPRRDARH